MKKITIILLTIILNLNLSFSQTEPNKLKFIIDQSTIRNKLSQERVKSEHNELGFGLITGKIRIGDHETFGVLGGYTCIDSKCIDKEHLVPPLAIQISPPPDCVDSRCIEIPEEVSLPIINLLPNYDCQYAICTELYFENKLLEPFRKMKMMLKPLSCTDAKCVDPNTKHVPDGSKETDAEKKSRKEQEEDAKNKEKTEAAEKEAKKKKEAKDKAEKEKKEAENKEKEAEEKKKKAEHSRKQAEYRSSKAKEKYNRERQNDQSSKATKTFRSLYNEALEDEKDALLKERQTNQTFEERVRDRIIAEKEFFQREREYNEAQERYEWNIEADRTIRIWRNSRDLCNSLGCDFKPIGLKQP
nr:hypothetical protein [uncultured Psychroserpens sp.]